MTRASIDLRSNSRRTWRVADSSLKASAQVRPHLGGVTRAIRRSQSDTSRTVTSWVAPSVTAVSPAAEVPLYIRGPLLGWPRRRRRAPWLSEMASDATSARSVPFERDRFIDAIRKLDTTKFFPDGVSYWDKQEQIHKNAHFNGVDVHGGPAFIPWHRVIVNRLEALLREVDPELSLHYWDWTTDPRVASGPRAALFTAQFMDNASGERQSPAHRLRVDRGRRDRQRAHQDLARRRVGRREPGRDPGHRHGRVDPEQLGLRDLRHRAEGRARQCRAQLHRRDHQQPALLLPRPVRVPPPLQRGPDLGEVADRPSASRAHRVRDGIRRTERGQLNALITEHVEPWAGGTGPGAVGLRPDQACRHQLPRPVRGLAALLRHQQQ